LISRDEAYSVRALVLVALVTRTTRGFAAEVRVGRAEGLPKACVVNCDSIVTLPKMDLIERAGSLSAAKIRELDDALRFVLGVDG